MATKQDLKNIKTKCIFWRTSLPKTPKKTTGNMVIKIFFNINWRPEGILHHLCTFYAVFFSIRVFYQGHWQLARQQGKGRDHLLFHSTTSTHSRKFKHLFATSHVRWLSHIFNRNPCIYQAATRWDLTPIELLFDWLTMWCWFSFVWMLIWF